MIGPDHHRALNDADASSRSLRCIGCLGERSGDVMPKPTRLALEMALHEEQERRALEGELAQLERAWREAEEIAAIADNLLLPDHTDEFLDRHSPRGGPGEPS